MERALEELIWDRARSLCEYCKFPAAVSELPFQIDHVIALKHGGQSASENLALACFYCNSFKGPNIAGIDPAEGKIARLFHPRQDHWADHFEWNGPILQARTAVGRATIQVLRINHPLVVEIRRWLIREGSFPPRG